MQIKEGAGVYTPTGDKLGGIDRVVIDPGSKEITHIVVRKGALLHKDKVVPAELIQYTADDRIVLSLAAGGDLESLPDFEEDYYVPASTREVPRGRFGSGSIMPLYWYPAASGAPYGLDAGPPALAARPRSLVNIPDHTVALKEGARVTSSDDEHVGDIHKVYTDAGSNRVSQIVIKSGILDKKERLIPIEWVDQIDEEEIHLSVSSEMVEWLPEYRP